MAVLGSNFGGEFDSRLVLHLFSVLVVLAPFTWLFSASEDHEGAKVRLPQAASARSLASIVWFACRMQHARRTLWATDHGACMGVLAERYSGRTVTSGVSALSATRE